MSKSVEGSKSKTWPKSWPLPMLKQMRISLLLWWDIQCLLRARCGSGLSRSEFRLVQSESTQDPRHVSVHQQSVQSFKVCTDQDL